MADEPLWRRYGRLWGSDPTADVEDELAFHITERARLNELAGLPPEQARVEAERRFGDLQRIRSECMVEHERSAGGIALKHRLADIGSDVRIGLRSLVRAPLFTLTAGLALALGIGANSAVFSVVNAVLLRPLPYGEPDRVVMVHSTWKGAEQARLSPAEYLDYQEQVRAFSAIGVYALATVNVAEGDAVEQVPAAVVSPSTFEALGISPAAGRFFAEEQGATQSEVLLSHEYWQQRFDGAPDLVGRDIQVNGTSRTVLGILPAGVRLPTTYAEVRPPAVFVPFRVTRADDPARGSHFLFGVARLADGWTVEAAGAELTRVAHALSAMYPDEYAAEMQFNAMLEPMHAAVVGEKRGVLLLLAAAVGLVLLIACVNVSSLVLTRTEDRRRELAVRSALGAGRWRIARQLLVEHLVLALIAGAAGVVLAVIGVHGLTLLQPGDIPRLAEAHVDGRVLAFTFLLSLIATLLVTLAALRQHADGHDSLREGGARTTSSRASARMRRTLIAAEVGLSVVLLTGAGLLLRSFANLISVDPGYRTDQLLTVPLALPPTSYPGDAERREFYARVVEEAAALSGVQAAGAVLNLPLASTIGDMGIELEGRPQREGDMSPRFDWQVVTPGWFEAMGVEIVQGRSIATSDHDRAAGAVVLSEAAARKYWPQGDAMGKRFKLGGEAGPGWVTVVGIARDVRHSALTDEPPAVMYLPHAQFTMWNGGRALASMTLVVHGGDRPLLLLPAIRELVQRVDPAVPIGEPQTMSQVMNAAVAAPRFATTVLGGFALLALALVLVGVYGLVGYTVARRSREIAVRMALGAQAPGVVRQIVLQAMRPVLIGAALGTVGALVLTSTLEQLLYGVAPRDAATMTASVGLLAATAFVACMLPAWRAARIAPLRALREE